MASMDVDEPSTSAQPAEAGAETYQLSLFQLVRTAQAENGIKHGDYMRYRRHCANRLQGIRKALKFQHGRTKYQNRKLEPATVTDARFLHIPLFNAERAWAYAMELKKDIENRMDLRKRKHLIQRLAKAKRWSDDAAWLISERCDTKSALEAEAYAAWMHGNLLLERESDWELALAKFLRAKTLLEQLGRLLPVEQQTLCLQQVEDMEPSIRYCEYQIGRKGGKVPDMKNLLALADQEGRGGMELLQSKLAALAQEAQAQAASSLSYLEWQGRKFPVRAERVKLALHQASEFARQLAEQQAADAAAGAAAGAGPSEGQLALFDRMINAYGEARTQLRSAAKSSAAADSPEDLAALDAALAGIAMERCVERTRLLVRDAEARFGVGLKQTALGKRAREGKGEGGVRTAKAEDVVRQLETLARNYQDLADLASSRLGGRQGEALHDECAAQVAAVQAARCYYVAHALLGGDKPLEAFVLLGRAGERVAQAQAKAAELARPNPGLAEQLGALAKQVAAYKLVAQADHAAAVLREKETVQKAVGSMSLAEQQAAAAGAAAEKGFLLDSLEQWESFAGQPGAKAPRIFRAPLPLQSVPVRPIMLDTAASLLEYPSLEHRVKKAAPKGYLSSIFGWRR